MFLIEDADSDSGKVMPLRSFFRPLMYILLNFSIELCRIFVINHYKVLFLWGDSENLMWI